MKNKTVGLICGLSLTAVALLPSIAPAQVPLSSGTYSQNFDTLANSGTTAAWADNTTIPGWFAAKAAGSGAPAIATYTVNAGAANSGVIYSYGLTNDVNRALGSLGSGTPKTQYYGLVFTNDTANALINFTVSYTGEEWRSPSIASNEFLGFSYRVGSSAVISDVDATNDPLWTAFSGLNFTIPETVNTANSMLDGTNPTNQVVLTNIVITGVSLQPGQALFLRWKDIDDSGSDAGLAIDNLTVSFTPTDAAPVPAYVLTQPVNSSIFVGDSTGFSVLAGGTAPFTYQWYFTNSAGIALLMDQTNSAMTMSYVTNAQAGGYFVAVTNTAGGTNSAVANLTVNARTPITNTIAYLRTLLNTTNWAPTDTTNLYCIQGIVTSHANTTGSTNCQFYMQDGAAGMLVFISGGSALVPAAGDLVQVTAPLSQFYGQLELNESVLNPAHSFANLSSGHSLPTPAVFDLASQGNVAYMKSIESSLVVVPNVFMQTGVGQFVGSSTVNLTNLSSVVFPLYVNSYVGDLIAQSIPAFASSVTGVISQHASGNVYTNGFQLLATQYADIMPGTVPTLPIPLTCQQSGNSLVLNWTDGTFYLQTATNVAGPYTYVLGATSPFTTNTVDAPALFFRLTTQAPD